MESITSFSGKMLNTVCSFGRQTYSVIDSLVLPHVLAEAGLTAYEGALLHRLAPAVKCLRWITPVGQTQIIVGVVAYRLTGRAFSALLDECSQLDERFNNDHPQCEQAIKNYSAFLNYVAMPIAMGAGALAAMSVSAAYPSLIVASYVCAAYKVTTYILFESGFFA